jgi:ribonucleoside-diphosphate reductase alpha chain
MQAALQPFVDNAISKTINIPPDYSFENFRHLYEEAHRLGLKGCTTFRPAAVRGEVLLPGHTGGDSAEGETGPHCCSIEREED